MKYLKKYYENNNNFLSKGDLVKLKHNISRDIDDEVVIQLMRLAFEEIK